VPCGGWFTGVHVRGCRAADHLLRTRVPGRRRARQPGQAEKLAAALGDRATVRSFTAAESAAYHSHIGAFVLMNGVVLDWIAKVLSAPQANRSRSEDRRDEQPEAEDAFR
jgi:hypothetical protein